jgi:xanthine dehydrogenase accessory factor
VRYELNDDFAQETGLVCGGQMEVFIEPVEASPELFVFGAGHVGYFVARMAHEVGFRVHVVDDREKFASRERFGPDIDVVVGGHPRPGWARSGFPPRLRGHRDARTPPRPRRPAGAHGEPAAVSRLIGSKAKVKRIFDALLEEGTVPDRLQNVYAPIGLDIGAITPQEIAGQHRGRAGGCEARKNCESRRTHRQHAVGGGSALYWNSTLSL